VSARTRPRPTPDLILLAVSLTLLVLGIGMVYSASFVVAQSEFGNDTYFLTRQVQWAVIGVIGMVVAASIDYHHLERFSVLIMLAVVVMMLLVLVPGMGSSSYGAQRWLLLGPLPAVQPSEFAKLALIIYMANWLAKKGRKVREFTYGFIPFATILITVIALIMAQPDLGTSFVIGVTAACIFFVAGANLLHFIMAGAGGVVGFLYLITTAGYRQDRIEAFLNPWADPQDTGWHTIQTLIALGSGGLTGHGLGASRQKFFYVPNAHTDSVFAIVGEELGLIGTFGVILLFAILAWRGFRVAFRAPDAFGRLLATGVTSLIIVQALTNIAVVTNTVPYTGLTLPFVSFGGSSLLISMVGIGLVLAVSRHEGSPAVGGGQREPIARTHQRTSSRQRVAASGTNLAAGRRPRSPRRV
jgi:cell division protein FtsW